MRFKEGASVFTSDGRKVGTIDRVVIDPETKEVVSVVVRKGFLLPEDKVVHISLIGPETEDRVVLRMNEGNFDTLPLFEETHYFPLTGDQAPPGEVVPVYWYPPGGVGWWDYPTFLGFPNPPYTVDIERNIPEGAVPLKEGARVMSADSQQVGDVKEVMTDVVTDRVTHMLITEGLLFKEQKLIPMTWVGRIAEDEVHLRVTSTFLEDLPEYRPTP